MKVLLDQYGLLEVAEGEVGASQSQLLSDLSEKEVLSFWVTTDSIAGVVRSLSTRYGRNVGRGFMDGFAKRCTVAPLRRAMLCDALEAQDGDLDANLNIAVARMFHLDCIFTRHPERYSHSAIAALSSNDFSAHLDRCKATPIEKVPFLDLKAQHSRIYTEIDERITRIIANTEFVLGQHVDDFEQRFAELQESNYCLGVSSGTAALHLALMALNIGPDDQVLLPVNTFIATAEAVSLVGATPVFVDCDEYYNIDVERLRDTIEMVISRDQRPPKALIVVHLYGQPADMTTIMALAAEYGLEVIEDACQAHLARFNGRTVGRFGKCAAFSFYPGKNMGAYGEAGALVTHDETVYLKAKMLRQHGEAERYQHHLIGHNYRMSAIQGAVLATKSKYLTQWTRKRRVIARCYHEILTEIEELTLPPERAGSECVYHLYVIQTDKRDELRQFLFENGIDTGIHYPRALHQHAAYKDLGYQENDFPVAEAAAERILSLPIYPELSHAQILYVGDRINTFFKTRVR